MLVQVIFLTKIIFNNTIYASDTITLLSSNNNIELIKESNIIYTINLKIQIV